MKRLVFDIEANGFLSSVNKVWCVATRDVDTLEKKTFDVDQIDEAIAYLSDADVLIGHNILLYDLPVLEKLYGFKYTGQVWDTLIASRMKFSRNTKHSLKHWGEYLERRKMIPQGKIGFEDFSKYSTEMLEYCEQDVEVNYVFFSRGLADFDFTHDSVRLESDIALIQAKSEEYGVSFDYESAMKLQAEIASKMETIASKVEDALGYSWTEIEYRLKNDGELTHHAVKLLEKVRREYPEFTHRAVKVHDRCLIKVPTKVTLDTKKLLQEKLISLGWEPVWKTEKGNPQMTRQGSVDPNLMKLNLGDANIGEYYVLKHRHSIVSGFFKNVREDGKIPSEANTLGAITARYTHRKIANLPATRSLYGQEIRELFGVEEGRVQVGSDLAGIEARLLAHYMNDEGFTEFISGKDENGEDNDVHGFNRKAIYKIANMEVTRDESKTFYYGLLYGAGDTKIGSIVGGGAKEGSLLKNSYFEMYPGLKATMDRIAKDGQKGFIISLDGRKINLTKSKGFRGENQYDVRKGLNSLLQSSGAIYFKRWIWFVDKFTKEENLDANLMISYHDEGQWSVANKDVELFKQILERAVKATDGYYQVNCPNAIDTKTGKNWGDCH